MQKAVWLVCKRFGLPKDMRLFVSKKVAMYARAKQWADQLCYWEYLFRQESHAYKWGDVHRELKREVYQWKETDNWIASNARIVRGFVMWHYTKVVKEIKHEKSQ